MRNAEDWRHMTSEQVWEAEKATGLDAYCTNSLLINGKGSVSCLSPDTIDEFTSNSQKQVLDESRLTDMGCLLFTNLRILPSVLTIPIAAYLQPLWQPKALIPTTSPIFQMAYFQDARLQTDMEEKKKYLCIQVLVTGRASDIRRYIEPVLAHALNLAPGRRLSVLVKLDKPPGHYTVRTVVSGFNQILNTTAAMSYVNTLDDIGKETSTGYIDIAGKNTTADVTFFDEKLAVPYPVELPAQTADQTFVLKIDRFGNTSYTWSLGNTSFPLALEEAAPLLFFPDSDVANSGRTVQTKNGSWVDLIFYVTTPIQPEHPIQKHSNEFFLIGYGQGLWNYSSVSEAIRYIPQSFNFNWPPILDTISTLPAATEPTWMAIRYQVNNPGAFHIHCHIQVHTSGGMALAILDGIDTWPEIPAEYRLS
ncbi:hypothetical protein N7465_011879 [Penicillium sp. CMV-2018d]|nr:hypothetical protein N7465_011879 [Penicillium sp. CMV-2018d]